MPVGKTARIQQADKQFGKHLNQIRRVCENDLHRETKCIEEIFKIEMVRMIELKHKITIRQKSL